MDVHAPTSTRMTDTMNQRRLRLLAYKCIVAYLEGDTQEPMDIIPVFCSKSDRRKARPDNAIAIGSFKRGWSDYVLLLDSGAFGVLDRRSGALFYRRIQIEDFLAALGKQTDGQTIISKACGNLERNLPRKITE